MPTDRPSPLEAALQAERQPAYKEVEARLILETVEDGIYGLDRDGVTTFANRAAEVMTGFHTEELLGRRQHEMIHHSYPDGSHHPAEACPIYRALRAGVTYRNSNDIFWRKDGSSFPVGYISKPILVEGSVEGTVVLFRDISRRKRHEAWARAKEEVMQSITSHQPIEETLNKIVSTYGELFPTCAAAIFTATPTELHLQAETGIPPAHKPQLLRANLLDRSFLCVRAALSRKETRSSRATDRNEPLRWLEDASISFCLARPLLSTSTGSLLGVIEFFAAQEQAFDVHASEWVDTLCDLTRLALEHHQLYAQLTLEHDRAEQALRQSEDRFRILADCCPTLMWITGSDGDLTFINRKFRELCGTTREAVSGSKWKLLAHPDDEFAASAAFQRAMEEKSDYFCTLRLLDGEGAWRTMESRAAALLSPAGEYLGHVGFNLDITERLQAESRLRESADRLALALQAGSIGIFDFDVHTGQFLWDDQMLRIFGVQREHFGTDHAAWQSIVDPGDHARVLQELRSALLSEKQFDTEVRVVWPDGTLRHIHALAIVQRDATGQALRMIGANWDVTSHTRSQQELQQINLRLQESIRRSNELAAAAADANAAKSSFLASMSHEIRTPMNGILGMIQLLLTTELTVEQKGFAAIAASSSGLLLTLIDDILDLSKIEAGKLLIEDEPFDLSLLFAETAALWRTQAALKGVGFETEIDPRTPTWVRGDGHRMRQILNNVVSNAVKFTERGRVTLHVHAEENANACPSIRFSVNDTGIGISAEQAARLFQPFVQADVTTTRRYGGSGLGLAISRQLVDALNGRMGLNSTLGYGSTFWFSLPLSATPEPADAAPCTRDFSNHGKPRFARTALQIQDPPHHKPSEARPLILVAEDNRVNRIVAQAQLHKLGYGSHAVADGREAVCAAAGHDYALILMDCEMPVMDGYTATHAIRSAGNNVPVIAVTAHAMPEDRVRCLAAGMDDFLSKPVDLAELEIVLHKWRPSRVDPASDPCRPAVMLPPRTFDANSMMSRLMEDQELARLVLDSFVAEFPRQLALLVKTSEGKDHRAALLQVHGLKGACFAVSGDALCQILLKMEALDVPHQWPAFSSCLAALADAFVAFQVESQPFRT